jgi:hypothetical protein
MVPWAAGMAILLDSGGGDRREVARELLERAARENPGNLFFQVELARAFPGAAATLTDGDPAFALENAAARRRAEGLSAAGGR